jgi:hypothetical protein
MDSPKQLAAKMAAVGRETDRVLHEAAQRMTPVLRLAMLAKGAGMWAALARDFAPKTRRRFILNRLAHDRRLYGWHEPQESREAS